MTKYFDRFRLLPKGNLYFLLARKGFILPLVFGAMAVLMSYFFIISFLSSGQTKTARHFIDSSHSLAIAKAGADWALTAYASGSYDCNPISKVLFGNSKKGDEFELQYPPELLNYVTNELDGELQVKMKISDIVSIPIPKDLNGFEQDPIEKTGVIEFTSVGTVGKASRKVRIKKGFKVFLIVHPVLSKFTLFLRDKPDGNYLNILEKKTKSSAFENGSPIILNNQGFDDSGKNLSFKVVKPNSQEFDLSLVTKDGFEKLIQRSGWVFLNSTTNDPWTMNLSGGGDYSEFDDRLLLRVGLYRNEELEKFLIKNHPAGQTIERLLERFQGMKTDYESRSASGDVHKKPSNILYLRYLFPNNSPKASLLRPFGTCSKFSPTLIFGPVYMKYLILRGIDVHFKYAGPAGGMLFKNVIIPGFPNKQSFENTYRPKTPEDPNLVTFASLLDIPDRNNAGPSYSKYSKIMTRVATSPYLAALDYIFLNKLERGTMLKPISEEYKMPPPQKIGNENTSKTKPWVGNRKSLFLGEGTFAMGNTKIFSGSLADIEGCKEFQSKLTEVFSSFDDFKINFFDEKTSSLRIPGIVYVGDKDITIKDNLKITNPGIIICGGNVCINSSIRSQYPVTIVSLKNITVKTSKTIEAHLICLKGKFSAPNGFNIKGSLAAYTMDIANMRKNTKTITFVPAHDPYNSEDKWKNKTLYRYQLSQEEEYCVEGGK